MTAPRLINIFGLSHRLGVSVADVRRLIDSGAFPVVTLPGGAVRVDPVDVEQWINDSKTERRTMRTQDYLRVVESARGCIARTQNGAGLNAQRIADDIIAKCGGDADKAIAALEAHGEGEAADDRSTIVQAALAKRHGKHGTTRPGGSSM